MKTKICLNGPELAQACQILKPVISKNMVLPILEDVLLNFKEGICTLTVTDMENSITVKMNFSQAAEDFSTAIPFVDMAAIKTKDIVIIEVDTETFVSVVSYGGIVSRITGENAEDFPRIPTGNAEGLVIAANSKAFTDALTFAGKDDMRPAQTGVLLEVLKDRKGCNIVSTDAHRLYIFETKDFETNHRDKDLQVIMPKRFVKMLSMFEVFTISAIPATRETEPKRKGKKAKTEIYYPNVLVTGKRPWKAGQQALEFSVVSRTIDATFPKYRAVIPSPNPVKVSFDDVEQLDRLVKHACTCANKTTHQVSFSINGEVTISSRDLDFSKEMTAVVPSTRVKKPTEEVMDIAFNGEFLQDNMKVLGSGLKVEMSTPSRAAMWSGDGSAARLLLMPIMINV